MRSSKERSWCYWVFLAGVSTWILLVVAAPILRGAHPAVGGFFYSFFAPICHQIPDRTIHLAGNPMAVCARCAGLYFGFWLGLVMIPSLPSVARHLATTPRLIILFSIPMAIDLVLSNTAWSRFLTGALASFPIAFFVWLALDQLRNSTAKEYI